MTNGMKMLLLNNTDNGSRNYPHTARNERMSGNYNRMGDNYTHEPTNAYSGYEMPENRRYKNGRYAPKNGGYDYENDENFEEPEMRYDTNMNYGGGEHNHNQMKMGFAVGGEDDDVMPFSQMTAEKWARSMQNDDGTTGPHWSMEQVKQVMAQKGVNCDPWEFFAALNAIYSDYSKVLKKHGVGDKLDVYVDLAKAFVNDKDAQPDKMARYFQYIVKH